MWLLQWHRLWNQHIVPSIEGLLCQWDMIKWRRFSPLLCCRCFNLLLGKHYILEWMSLLSFMLLWRGLVCLSQVPLFHCSGFHCWLVDSVWPYLGSRKEIDRGLGLVQVGFDDPGEMKQLGLYPEVLSEVVLLLHFVLPSLYCVGFCWVLPQHLCNLICLRFLIARQRIFCLFIEVWCFEVISDSKNYQRYVDKTGDCISMVTAIFGYYFSINNN